MAKSYRWKKAPFWLGLLLFWLISMMGAGALARAGYGGSEAGWITLCMLVFVVMCMITERGRWKTWARIAYVPGAWILQALLSVLIAFVYIALATRADYADRAITFFASVPIVVFAMRQSRLFTSGIESEAAPVEKTSP